MNAPEIKRQPSEQSILEARGLTHVYGTGAAAVRALDRVDVDFRTGELTLIAGPSGSGKSTLLALLGCLLVPTEGAITILGRAAHSKAATLTRLRREHIGFIFQSFRLLRALDALENVAVALEIRGVSRKRRRIAALEALHAMGLEGKEHRLPHELSGGEQQRVGIARALVTDPEIVLADEPTASLDRETGLAIARLLRGLAVDKDKAVVIVSHDPRLTPFADRRLVIEDGRLVEDNVMSQVA